MKIHILTDGEFTGYDSVRLSVNCYLISYADQNILIDTGIGNNSFFDTDKYSVKYPRKLLTSIKDHGLGPENITKIIYTHLHFDHSNGSFDSDGKCIFKNAKHLIQETEWMRFLNCDSDIRKNLFLNLYESGNMELIHGSACIDGKIKLILCGGHTEGFQYAKVNINGQEHIFAGDIIPTVWHINNGNSPGIDHDIEKTFEIKREILESCISNKSLLYFQHSSMTRSSRIVRYGERFKTIKI
ncbi:MAG TPA: MBL fold metallo-hydrolase [Clostridiales bacterium]|nr:MBL fold metallo-hydrolase [Clostridiales bacterium]HQP69911.1 MBL fold metallo-hydrolase [Clostridiales bacterium]